jgi:DNA-binding response OmpR family regulator
MKFDHQNRQPGIEALAGSIRLKARLQLAITGFDRQISLEVCKGYKPMKFQATVLLVDDEPDVITVLTPLLKRAGFVVAVAEDGQAAWDYLQNHGIDLIVLDVIMPKMDGYELLRYLREAGDMTPIILLSKVGDSTARARTLDSGADDYLNKPFDPHELLARIRAVLSRVQKGPRFTNARRLVNGDLCLDRVARRVWQAAQERFLTSKAFTVLEYLMTHAGEMITSERLLDVVWGWDNPAGTGALRTRIAELRRVLNDSLAQPRYIETVSGKGYRFVGSVEVCHDE